MDGMGDHGGMGDGMNDGMMSMPHKKNKMMMHMTFFWGKDAEILFSGWPGHSLSMYVLALFFVFILSVTVEWLCGSRLIRPGTNRVSAGLHALRIGLANMVMLAVMSFNAGVLIVAVAGHAIGFLLFGSRVFKPAESEEPGLGSPYRAEGSPDLTLIVMLAIISFNAGVLIVAVAGHAIGLLLFGSRVSRRLSRRSRVKST